jgi:hypothetical protein
MGRRDYRHREPKKTKKDAKKVLPATILTPSETVEVVRKAKRERKEEEES